MTTDPVIKATADTFRYIAELGKYPDPPADPFDFTALPIDLTTERAYQIAQAVEALSEDEMCCPVCEEVTCDEGCPLEPVRARWQQVTGRPPSAG